MTSSTHFFLTLCQTEPKQGENHGTTRAYLGFIEIMLCHFA